MNQNWKKKLIRVTYILKIRVSWILQISKIQMNFVKISFLD